MNILEELRKTRKELKELEAIIDIQKNLCDEDPDSFAYKLSLQGLRSRSVELNNRLTYFLSQRSLEVINIRIDGPPIGRGTIPLSILGGTLTAFQNVVSSIAQSLHSGATSKGRISAPVLGASELQFGGSFEGSFGIKIIGKTGPVLFGESLLAQSIDCLFELLNASDSSEELLKVVGKAGTRTLSHYKELINHLVSSRVSVRTDWLDLEGNNVEWQSSLGVLENIAILLEQINNSEPEFKEYEGALLGASLIRNKFEFIIHETGEKISGEISAETRQAVQDNFGCNCTGKFQMDTIKNLVTGQTRVNWTLIGIEPVN